MSDRLKWKLDRMKDLTEASEVAFDECVKVLETPIPTDGEAKIGTDKHKVAVESKQKAFQVAKEILTGIEELNGILDAGGTESTSGGNRAERTASRGGSSA